MMTGGHQDDIANGTGKDGGASLAGLSVYWRKSARAAHATIISLTAWYTTLQELLCSISGLRQHACQIYLP
jgi:hypothetical protein